VRGRLAISSFALPIEWGNPTHDGFSAKKNEPRSVSASPKSKSGFYFFVRDCLQRLFVVASYITQTRSLLPNLAINLGIGRLPCGEPVDIAPGTLMCAIPLTSLHSLEQELQCHLNYPRAHIRLDLPERRRFNVADRQAEVGMVQGIKYFSAELKFFRFRQLNVLEG
jgi:hypothetical protein